MQNKKKIHVIVNPAAGNFRAKKVALKICKRLSKLPHDVKVFYTKYPGHATKISKESSLQDVDCVLSVGGDGTCYEVAQGIIDSNTSLGVIPAGTGNDFVKSLNFPKDPVKCLDKILDSEGRLIDIGKINDEIFMNVCGVGFDVSVLEYSLKAKKFTKGMLPYLYGVVRTIINYNPTNVTITVDGEVKISEDILVCCVANGKYFGGGIKVSPLSEVDDGFLDIIMVKNVKRAKMVKYLPGLLAGKILEFEDTVTYRGKKIMFSSPTPMKINVDGEIKTYTNAIFEILPKSLKVCF